MLDTDLPWSICGPNHKSYAIWSPNGCFLWQAVVPARAFGTHPALTSSISVLISSSSASCKGWQKITVPQMNDRSAQPVTGTRSTVFACASTHSAINGYFLKWILAFTALLLFKTVNTCAKLIKSMHGVWTLVSTMINTNTLPAWD